MNLGAFGVIASLRQRNVIGDEMDDIAGLFFRAPTEAVLMLIFLLSLAGIPLTAGFLGKFYVLTAGAAASRWVLLFTLIVSSTIGLFYYLRIVVVMYAQPTAPGTKRDAPALPMPLPSTVALAALTGLVFLLGIYPAMFWNTIVAVTRSLG